MSNVRPSLALFFILISREYPNAWLEVLPGQPPVLLNAKKVDQENKGLVKINKSILNKITRGVPQEFTKR